MSTKKLLILTNTDWHFCAHLMPIAIEAQRRGYSVVLVVDISNAKFIDEITAKGIKVIPIQIKRSSINIVREILLLAKIIRIIKEEKPQVLHNFTMKPILYGSISGTICKVPKIINNFLGMGILFTSSNTLIGCVRRIVTWQLLLLSRSKNMIFIVQNGDDRKLLLELKIATHDNLVSQCSVGIKSTKFPLLENIEGPIIFTLMARMVIDKGIYEFIEASRLLTSKNLAAEFWLVGEPDNDSKISIPISLLKYHHDQGYIKYLGYQTNIENIWQHSHVAVLPSYREGLSRVLLEAGAYGRALITTDAPGGREVVKHQTTGLLVKVKNAIDLANSMELLVNDHELRTKLGMNARNHIITNYDCDLIVKKTVDLY
ncbi:MAG: glycosyltransferase family 1 protein [Rickettsiaceae bacterium]|nr:MAG: glycosyltransferase family 1 protein [Rickettsiaceae bacterium]